MKQGIREVFICLSKHVAEKKSAIFVGVLLFGWFSLNIVVEKIGSCAGKYEFRSLLPIKRLFRMSREGTSQYKME